MHSSNLSTLLVLVSALVASPVSGLHHPHNQPQHVKMHPGMRRIGQDLKGQESSNNLRPRQQGTIEQYMKSFPIEVAPDQSTAQPLPADATVSLLVANATPDAKMVDLKAEIRGDVAIYAAASSASANGDLLDAGAGSSSDAEGSTGAAATATRQALSPPSQRVAIQTASVTIPSNAQARGPLDSSSSLVGDAADAQTSASSSNGRAPISSTAVDASGSVVTTGLLTRIPISSTATAGRSAISSVATSSIGTSSTATTDDTATIRQPVRTAITASTSSADDSATIDSATDSTTTLTAGATSNEETTVSPTSSSLGTEVNVSSAPTATDGSSLLSGLDDLTGGEASSTENPSNDSEPSLTTSDGVELSASAQSTHVVTANSIVVVVADGVTGSITTRVRSTSTHFIYVTATPESTDGTTETSATGGLAIFGGQTSGVGRSFNARAFLAGAIACMSTLIVLS